MIRQTLFFLATVNVKMKENVMIRQTLFFLATVNVKMKENFF
jgi:hypothetical protein